MVRAFTDDQIRKVLLELRYIYTAAALCAKWQITRYRLQQWQQQFNYKYLVGDVRELVIAGLHQGVQDVPTLSKFIDYHDHSVYSIDELTSILESLQIDGIAILKNGRWLYNPKHSHGDRSFIF
jgi:hypothetical protein